jgi:intracellular septation protein
MKVLFDFFPVLLFFLAFKLSDNPKEGILIATAVAIAASVVQVVLYWGKYRRVERMHLITLGLILVFGGLTLVLEDEMFIKWKPTVLNWLFALVFLASQLVGRKPLVQRMMEAKIALPAAIWQRLNLSWVVFFVTVGFINLYVVYHFDTDTWVTFKLFGLMGLTVAFVVGQGLLLARHVKTDDQAEEPN